MQLFRLCKVPFYRLFPQRIPFPDTVGVPVLIRLFDILRPHVARHRLGVRLTCRTLRQMGAMLTDLCFNSDKELIQTYYCWLTDSVCRGNKR